MITIGISESDTNFQYYAPYIKGTADDVEIMILSYAKRSAGDLYRCDGIVLSGGLDVHPRFYNHSRLDYPLAQEFNEIRDEWEFTVFEYARHHRLPVLAICRGMQIVNIALGGDLIQDLEEHGKHNHRRTSERDGIHKIFIDKGSLIFSITNCQTGRINSAHHQGLGLLAPELTASAHAEDKMIEAIEYQDKKANAFLLGVQWHPERLHIVEGDAQFSENIRSAFIAAVKTNKTDKTSRGGLRIN